MGYRLWKWLLLVLLLVGCGTWYMLSKQPNLLGGEEVVASYTTLDPNSVSVRNNYFGINVGWMH